MPPVVIAAVALAGTAIGGVIGATLIMYAVEIGYALTVLAAVATMRYQQRRAEARARDAYNRSQKDRYLMVRGALEARQIVLGRRRSSGPLFYVGTYGEDREHLVFCVALASHKVASIGDVYIGDEPVVLDGSGNIIGIKRTEQFSISAATGSFTLAGKAKVGSVTARALYGSDTVSLGATVTTSSTASTVAVTGARVGELGTVVIDYQPDPCPYKPADAKTSLQGFTLTTLPQTFTLSTTPTAGTVNVVQNLAGDGGMQALAFTTSGNTVTVTTGTTGQGISITYQAQQATSLGRVRKYTGRWDQAADPGMIAALPGLWTSAHRAAGVAYLVVEFDYDRDATSGGIPNVSAEVYGLECFDPRKNRIAAWQGDDAVPGTPGTLPSGWIMTTGSGISRQVVGAGTDEATGLPYVDLRYFGTATAAGSGLVQFMGTADVTAASGQVWGARLSVRRLAGMAWSAWTNPRMVINARKSDGSSNGSTSFAMAAADGVLDPVEGTYTMPALTTSVIMRLQMEFTSGQAVDSTFRVMLPQLWQGAIDSAADCQAWTDNTALQTIGYATHPLGGRLPWDQVDVAEASAQANVCDSTAVYTVGSWDYVFPLYRSHYIALTNQRPTEVLTDLCTAMGGEWVYANGKLRLKAGAWRAPIRTLDESWLQGDQPVQIQATLDRDETFNAISGSFYDANQKWQQVDFPAVEPAAYIAADKAKLPLSVEYEAVTFVGQAQYLAACSLRAVRQGMVLKVRCNMRAWELEDFDTINVTLARFGFVNKTFEVRRTAWTLDGGIELLLRETDATTWDMDAGFPAIDPAPNTRLPDPWSVAPVTSLAADSGTAQLLLQADGTVVSRVRVTWDASSDPRVTEPSGLVEIAYGLATQDESLWQVIQVPGAETQAYLTGVRDNTLILIKARALGSMGRSPWSAHVLHLVQGKSAAPSGVTGLAASIVFGAVAIEWEPCTDLDYAETELRLGTSWASATPLVGTQPTRITGTKYLWAWPSPGSKSILAKHRDTSGNYSTTTAATVVLVDDTIKLGSSGIDVDLGGINLVVNSSFERDSNADGLADSWLTYAAGTVGTVATSRVTGRNGGKAQRRDAASLGSTTADRLGIRQDIAVGPGAIQNLAATAWMRASANVTVQLRVDYLDAGGALVGTAGSQSFVSDATTWKRPELRLTSVPSTVATVRLWLWVQARTSGTAVWLEVDDVQVEEGTAASSWHPSPGEALNKLWIQAADPGAGAVDGDEWFDTDDSNKHWVRIGGAWVTVRDAGITQALVDAANAQSTADGKIQSYYQASPPTGASVGDLWYDTDDSKKPYRWSGSAWVLARDDGVAQALADASDAQATADGKVTTFFSSTTPTAGAAGDLWFKTTDARMYRWSGSAWVLQSAVGTGDITTGKLADGAATTIYTLDVTGPVTVNTSITEVARISFTPPVDCLVICTAALTVEITPFADTPQRAWANHFLDSFVGGASFTGQTPVITDTTTTTVTVTTTDTFDAFASSATWCRLVVQGVGKTSTCYVSKVLFRVELIKK